MPAAHRHGDLRSCGAATVVVNQATTYCEGKLWAVTGDLNSHGNGQLIASGNGVFVQGKPVIVVFPDAAEPDDLCPPLNGEHCNPKTASGSAVTFAYG